MSTDAKTETPSRNRLGRRNGPLAVRLPSRPPYVGAYELPLLVSSLRAEPRLRRRRVRRAGRPEGGDLASP